MWEQYRGLLAHSFMKLKIAFEEITTASNTNLP